MRIITELQAPSEVGFCHTVVSTSDLRCVLHPLCPSPVVPVDLRAQWPWRSGTDTPSSSRFSAESGW